MNISKSLVELGSIHAFRAQRVNEQTFAFLLITLVLAIWPQITEFVQRNTLTRVTGILVFCTLWGIWNTSSVANSSVFLLITGIEHNYLYSKMIFIAFLYFIYIHRVGFLTIKILFWNEAIKNNVFFWYCHLKHGEYHKLPDTYSVSCTAIVYPILIFLSNHGLDRTEKVVEHYQYAKFN